MWNLFVENTCSTKKFKYLPSKKHEANVNQLDIYDQSALAYAADGADIEIVKLLVSSGANINTRDINGIYPLHVAVNRKDDEICDYLINEGALINCIDK